MNPPFDKFNPTTTHWVHSADPQKSASAASDLAAGWRSDGALTKVLVESAQQTKLIPHGVENTLRVLQAQDATALRPNRAAVEEFTQRVATNNSSTRALVEQIQSKY